MATLPAALIDSLADALGGPVQPGRGAAGGCINQAAVVRCGTETIFVKWHQRPPEGFFEAEAEGLRRIAAPGVIQVPAPLAWSDAAGDCPAFLAMTWIDGPKGEFDRDAFGRRFGESLAALHRQLSPTYGLDRDNFIGSLPQPNPATSGWVPFFGKHRLGAQLALAEDRGALRPHQITKVEKLIERLPELIPADPGASLLHGDLWSGNYMIGAAGQPVLVDPAVYCGHREVDLAFTELFGGFPSVFYSAYNAAWPLDPGYRSRRDLYNSYPLLVHVNLFGGGYVRQLMRVVEAFL